MRATALLALLFLAAGAARAQAQDPVEVAPDHYSVVFENDEVRVLRIQYGPGDQTVMHEHPDGVAVFVTDGSFRFTLPDGTTVEASGKAGDAIWSPGGPHAPQNIGPAAAEVILVELKDDGEDDD